MTSLRVAFVVALAASLLGGALGSRSARAESPEEEVERLANQALSAYRGADYNRAVELLKQAYAIRQVPALQYNLAKAYDKLGDLEHAYDAYRQYVDSAAAEPKLKARAEARLTVLEEARRKKAAGARAAEAPPPATATTPAARETAPTAPPRETAPPAPVEPPKPPPPRPEELRAAAHEGFVRDRHRARVTTIALGAATVALAAVAVGLSADALALQGQFDRATLPATKSQLKSDAVVRAGVADAFWAATAVSAAVTGYFVYRSFRHEPSSPPLALAPLLAPTGGGLAAVGRF